MIAVEGNRERQVHDAVVRREVVGPQEGLLAQLDRRGEEAEHGDQDRHLDQHRNTAAHGVDARLFIKLHRRLLLFHGVLRLGILLRQFVDLGFDQTHLGHRNVTLVGQRRDHQLHQKHQDEDDDAETADVVAQEVEDRNHAPAVDPSEDAPAQRHETLQINIRTARLPDLLEDRVLVGAEIECEVIPFGLRRIGHAHLRCEGLEQRRLGSRRVEGEVGVGHVVRGDEHRREELLLESHPVDLRRDILRLCAFAHAQLLDRGLVGETVRERGVHVFVLEAAFVLEGVVRPVDLDLGLVGHGVGHVDQPHVEVDQIVALRGLRIIYKVAVLQRSPFGHGQTHDHLPGPVIERLDGLRLEDVVQRVDGDVPQADVEGSISSTGWLRSPRGAYLVKSFRVTPLTCPPRVEKRTIITSFSTVNSSASASRAAVRASPSVST